jgi:hypothetical protein
MSMPDTPADTSLARTVAPAGAPPVPAPPSWPWRRAALFLAGAAQLITISALVSADPLSLRSCRFQYGVAGLGQPARLQHDGTVTAAGQPWDADADGLPPGADIELLVESGGIFRGRFLMTPLPGAHPTLEQRILAVAFADQAGAALGTSHPVDQA